MAKDHFAEGPNTNWPELSSSVVSQHLSAKLSGFEAQILRLPNPIISYTTDVTSIMDVKFRGKRIRVYPPSLLDRRGEITGAFKYAWLPEGASEIQKYVRIDDSAVRGFVTTVHPNQECSHCEVLRLDIEIGADAYDFVNHLIENIGQHTHQWWLRGKADPFRGMRHFGSEVNTDFSLREILRYAGAGKLESPWYGASETQGLQGLEKPLSNGVWLRCCHDSALGIRGEPGFMAFHDAICNYMARDDEFCVLSLCIAFEILGNKNRMLENKKSVDFNELMRTSPLLSAEHKQTIRNLFIDRGHVAHGRKLHILGNQSGVTLENYVLAISNVVQKFLELLPVGGWPEVAAMDIGKKGGR